MIFRAVALIATITGGLWIDVPFMKQEKNGCGSASIWMVMEYWRKSPAPVDEIQRTLYSREAEGVYAADMADYFAAHGFRTLAFSGEWGDLVDNVSGGRPLIVCLGASSRGAPLHYVVVAGIQEVQEIVLVNDPAQRKLWPIPRSEFEQRWSAMGRWTLLAIPEYPEGRGDEPVRPQAAPSPELIAASNAFRQQDYRLAAQLASRAARKEPETVLANELLATTYFLENNLEAALKYWNRAGEPHIGEITFNVAAGSDPVVLERSIPISRASILHLSDYRLARKRLDASGTFSSYTFDLKPSGENDFNLTLNAAERGNLRWLSWLRGLPYRTIAPEFTNVSGRGINVSALWRWDADKRRESIGISGTLGETVRYHAGADIRDENWEWKGSRFRLWRQDIDGGISQVATDRLTWSTDATVSRRSSGLGLKPGGTIQYDLWSIPEKRFSVATALRGELGSLLSQDRRYGRIEPQIRVHWLPQSRGTDYETRVSIRTGRVLGDAPFDELFSVGLDRDSDLRMRAHPATHDGLKGAGLIGPRYFLWNSDVAKNVADYGLINIKLAPFADVARMSGWYVDAGVELRFSVASLFTFSVSAGRDLMAGRNVIFTDVMK